MYKLILLFLFSTSIYSFELPNKALTPGDVDHERTKEVLCVPNFTAGKDDDGENVRHVSQKIKNIAFQEYGIPKEQRSNYVIDHLVSLSNGGLNNLYNLWPQPKNEGHLKDRLENKLHKMVCKGQITLQEAQNALSDDWGVSYSKYIEE
jgi:hypothetical protein